jgi:hypothetical protein
MSWKRAMNAEQVIVAYFKAHPIILLNRLIKTHEES